MGDIFSALALIKNTYDEYGFVGDVIQKGFDWFTNDGGERTRADFQGMKEMLIANKLLELHKGVDVAADLYRAGIISKSIAVKCFLIARARAGLIPSINPAVAGFKADDDDASYPTDSMKYRIRSLIAQEAVTNQIAAAPPVYALPMPDDGNDDGFLAPVMKMID